MHPIEITGLMREAADRIRRQIDNGYGGELARLSAKAQASGSIRPAGRIQRSGQQGS